MRDGYSNFKFLQALAPQITTDPPAEAGIQIDKAGYETVVFMINVGDLASAGAMAADDFFQFKLEHGLLESDAGAEAWSEVYPSEMLHSVVGVDGAYSGLDSGIFQSIISSTQGSAVYFVGYKGPARYVRIYISGENTPSTMQVGAMAILGLPANWPVNTPV